ncbi:hypothetical protein Ancab_016752 [Ancistrocladus abbreviatus]
MAVATRESSRRLQASVGTHHNLSLLSTMAGKHLSQITSDAQGSQDVATDWILTETCNLLRLAPETTQNIEEFVLKFYESLPSTTIVCLSLLGGAYPMLLQKFLPHRPVHAWMLLSNLNALSEPVVILIPLNSVLQDLDDKTNFSYSAVGEENMVRQWHCPWGPSVVVVIDDLAPMFKSILRGNYASSLPIEDAERNRAIWWMQRNDLDQHLCTLLRNDLRIVYNFICIKESAEF